MKYINLSSKKITLSFKGRQDKEVLPGKIVNFSKNKYADLVNKDTLNELKLIKNSELSKLIKSKQYNDLVSKKDKKNIKKNKEA